MGLFDFLKTDASSKKQAPTKEQGIRSVKAKGKLDSVGVVKVDSFSFNVRDYNMKGFLIDPYDKDILIKGQKFRFEIEVSKGDHTMKGRGEAVVTKVADTALAAAFTITPYES